jgi:hypothetical protein
MAVPALEPQPAGPSHDPPPHPGGFRWLFGPPRDLNDRSLLHRLALIPFLAWVGLGADGLSSSSYGPMESFLALGEHRYLAIFLAGATAATVFVIASAYRYIIEDFPQGGGGYIVATKLLGRPAGVLSGCALLVDYVLTIAVSLAAAADALFSVLPLSWQGARLPTEAMLVAGLCILNIRGVKESITPLVPVFLLFVATHLALVLGGLSQHWVELPTVVSGVGTDLRSGVASLGVIGLLSLTARAWSLGGGTYTGIEAVSNGMPILREPRVRTARRTMVYMAVSLAFTATGLMVCYLVAGVRPMEGQTLNSVLSGLVFGGWPLGRALVVATLASEGALLVVAAQAGFIDGPRVLANMAVDGWTPRRFAALSDRLTTRNGILTMSIAALALLLYTRGNVSALVVMYSINVFLTFTLSMVGMLRASLKARAWRRVLLFVTGALLCGTILLVTSVEKFGSGGWLTFLITAGAAAICFAVQQHYRRVADLVTRIDLCDDGCEPASRARIGPVNLDHPTAVFLVGAYSGLGVGTVRTAFTEFGDHFRNVVFLSVGVVDSMAVRTGDGMEAVRERMEETTSRYVGLARRMGLPAEARVGLGTDAVQTLTDLCVEVAAEFSDPTFFAGQLVLCPDRWFHRFLHNDTAFAIQRKLQASGHTLVIIPRVV